VEQNFFVDEAKAKVAKIEPEITAMTVKATALQVVDDQSYLLAAETGKEAARRIKIVKENFEPPKTAAHKAWKAVCALEKTILTPLEAIKTGMNKKMGFYDLEKERKAKAEEEKRLAEAKKIAEQERLEQAKKLEEAGDDEGAAQALEEACEPEMAPAAQPIEKAPKVDGVIHKTIFKFRVANAQKIPREYLTEDLPKIRKVVQALGKDANIPGIEVYSERVTAFK